MHVAVSVLVTKCEISARARACTYSLRGALGTTAGTDMDLRIVVSRLLTTGLDRSWTEHVDSCWGWARPSSALLQLTVAKPDMCSHVGEPVLAV